jgi:hypothetical protein
MRSPNHRNFGEVCGAGVSPAVFPLRHRGVRPPAGRQRYKTDFQQYGDYGRKNKRRLSCGEVLLHRG